MHSRCRGFVALTPTRPDGPELRVFRLRMKICIYHVHFSTSLRQMSIRQLKDHIILDYCISFHRHISIFSERDEPLLSLHDDPSDDTEYDRVSSCIRAL